ncbi:MAG TPA: hypothetical protein VM120_25050 [Bryobacteraceae bacterium]|nr:hypothetical protein [Bryobacteraceae bacterium]
MKFLPIPDPRTGAVNKQMLADLQQANILPHNIGAFASEGDFIAAAGSGAPTEGSGAKFWRDSATVWNFQTERFQYVILDRTPDGNLTRLPLDFSDTAFSIFSLSTANFYRQYAKHFPVIPRPVIKTMTRYDAGRLNFATGITEDYPLGILHEDFTGPIDGYRASFPSNMALRFHPQTGQPEAFYWEEYVREYPFDWTPVAPPAPGGVQKLSDGELISSVTGVITSTMSLKDKASAVRQLAGR